MQQITRVQLLKLVRYCFEHLEEVFSEEYKGVSGKPWPYYAPFNEKKEALRLRKNRLHTLYWIKTFWAQKRFDDAYGHLTFYMAHFWTEWFILQSCIQNGSQDGIRKPDTLLLLSALCREIKEMGFSLDNVDM